MTTDQTTRCRELIAGGSQLGLEALRVALGLAVVDKFRIPSVRRQDLPRVLLAEATMTEVEIEEKASSLPSEPE